MKKIYKCLSGAALSALVCMSLALPANAQHREGGGGGGGVSRPSGGGGGGGGFSRPSAPPPSSAPRMSVAPPQRSGGGNAGFQSRGYQQAGGGFQRGNIGPQRNYNPGNNFNAQRGNFAPRVGVTNRPYVQGNIPSYRYGNRGIGANYGAHGYYGHVGGYFGNHGYYHYYHGYYNSYYAPRLGFSVGFLPYGYYPFYWGDSQYYYSSGLYYTYTNSEYTVVEPPIGAEITTLPSNAQSIMINGQQYYEANGVYYQPIVKDDGTTTYQIAGKDGELNTGDGTNADNAQQAPQIGDVIDTLPPNCKKIKLNGEKFFVSQDGYYYQQVVDSGGHSVYKIVGTPTDEPEG